MYVLCVKCCKPFRVAAAGRLTTLQEELTRRPPADTLLRRTAPTGRFKESHRLRMVRPWPQPRVARTGSPLTSYASVAWAAAKLSIARSRDQAMLHGQELPLPGFHSLRRRTRQGSDPTQCGGGSDRDARALPSGVQQRRRRWSPRLVGYAPATMILFRRRGGYCADRPPRVPIE